MLYGFLALVFLAILFAGAGYWRMRTKLFREGDGMGWPRGDREAKWIAFIGFAVVLLMFVAATLAYSLVRP